MAYPNRSFRFRLVLELALFATLAVCRPVTATAFQLSGQVTDASNNPIASVDVVLFNAGNPVASSTTDSNGNYSLAIGAGTYSVVLTPPVGSGFNSATIPLVITGDTVQEFTLVSIVPLVSFSGVLQDASGTPVAGETISLCLYGCFSYYCPYSTSTGGDGSFSFSGVTPGNYNLDIAGGGGSLPQSFSVCSSINLTASVMQDLTLPPTAELTVTVKDPTGNVVPNASVSVSGSTGSFELYSGGTASASASASGTTDGGGSVQFLLFDGSSVTAYAYPPSGSGLYSGSNSATMSGATTLEIDLAALVSFSGVLQDATLAPVANQYVCLYYYACSATDGSGNFTISGLPPGASSPIYIYGGGGSLPDSYYVWGPYITVAIDTVQNLTLPPTAELTVTVKDPASQPVLNATVYIYPSVNFDLYPGGGATAYADSGATDFTDAGGSVQFLLFDGSSVTAYAYPPSGSGLYSGSNSATMLGATTLEIDLAALVSFSGVLQDATLAPVANQYVCLYYYACSATDGSGNFTISGLPPGASSPIYIYGGGGSLPDSYYVWGPYITVAIDTVQDLTLPPTAELTVSVKDPMSNGVPNATVYIYPSVNFDLYPGGGATAYADSGATDSTDGGGIVQFLLFDGSSVTAYAYPPSGSGLYSGSNSATMSGATTLEIDLTAIPPPPPPVSFSGVLQDASGTPVANQQVWLDYCYDVCTESTTGSDGSFSFTGLAPGTYTIYVTGGGGSLPDSFSLYGPDISLTTDTVQDLTLPNIVLTVTVISPSGTGVPNVQISASGGATSNLFTGGTFSGSLGVTRTTDANGVAYLPLLSSSSVSLTATPPAGNEFLPTNLSARTFASNTGIAILLQSLCGDGIIQPGEQCDDGNSNSGDGCSSTCQIEPCFACSGAPSLCTPLSAGAQCPDEGNVCTTDVCDNSGHCTHPPGNRGTLCRMPAGACDLAGFCTGSSPVCPNTTKPDGTACDDGVFCNGADTCSGGVCAQHAGDPCVPGSECNHTCNEASRNCFDPQNTACSDDGKVCTTHSVCDGSGRCTYTAVAPPQCPTGYAALRWRATPTGAHTDILATIGRGTAIHGSVCADVIKTGGNTVTDGDLVALATSGSAISFLRQEKVGGHVITGGGSISHPSAAVIGGGAPDTSGTASQLTECDQAADKVAAERTLRLAAPVDLSLGALTVVNSDPQTISVASAPGHGSAVVVEVPRIQLRSFGRLTLAGDATTQELVVRTSLLSVGGGAQIVLQNLQPEQVLWLVDGPAKLYGFAMVPGTILATGQISTGYRSEIDGAVLGDTNFTFSAYAVLNSHPFAGF